jgi:hypothetical protein
LRRLFNDRRRTRRSLALRRQWIRFRDGDKRRPGRNSHIKPGFDGMRRGHEPTRRRDGDDRQTRNSHSSQSDEGAADNAGEPQVIAAQNSTAVE